MIPFRNLFFGYGATVPLASSALLSALVPAARGGFVPRAGTIWAGTMLAFLGGVRRGLSFRQPGGPETGQMFGMLRLFSFALAGLLAPKRWVSSLLFAAGFVDVAVGDPALAREGEAPGFFAELRPPQMTIVVGSLLLLAWAESRTRPR